ncbi:calcium-binding protein [Paracoccus jiaweipingae]|uniref:calcium-binding protein n=1 Tax=unclassified Paracoccus (in: a-proteobacteria) TaxID=2688777 RepID=UPI0037B72329
MTVVSFNALFIGTLPDMDPQEDPYYPALGNGEYVHYYLNNQTFGAGTDPLYSHSTRVTLTDNGSDGGVEHNQYNPGGDTISYYANGYLQSAQVDTGGVINNVLITQAMPGGTTRSFYATVRIMQDTYGNTFILPPKADGSDSTEGDVSQYPIVSVRFPSYQGNYDTNYGGVSTDRTSLANFQDGYVDGNDLANTIDYDYTGDRDGDRVDHNDPWLPGAVGNDDYIRAYGGNDTVYAGAGRDVVEGGEGDDLIYGYSRGSDDGASDTLYGEDGNDSLDGGDGRDLLDGGTARARKRCADPATGRTSGPPRRGARLAATGAGRSRRSGALAPQDPAADPAFARAQR